MKKPDPINKVQHSDEFSSGLMESYGKWMGGDCFQNTQMPDLHEAPFDGMDPQSNGAEIEQTSIKKKEVKKPSAKAQLATKEEYEVLEREEYEIDGETWVLEKRLYAVEGSMETARKNVGASTCWKGYKAAGTKKKNGKTVPNCVKAGDEITHEGEELEEAKRGLYANIHAKRKRGEAPAKPGDEDYPAKDAFKKAAKTAKKEEVELEEKKGSLKQARKNVGADTCWDGYKAKGTKKKNGREVPNCVKEEEITEKKKGLWDNIHAKRKRGEKPAKPGDKDYPKTLNIESNEKLEEAAPALVGVLAKMAAKKAAAHVAKKGAEKVKDKMGKLLKGDEEEEG